MMKNRVHCLKGDENWPICFMLDRTNDKRRRLVFQNCIVLVQWTRFDKNSIKPAIF